MGLEFWFLVYALIYRLAIVAIGITCVALGYRLFMKGAFDKGETGAGAEIGEVKLTVSNAAPGTCFALFGSAVIVAMVVQGNPEYLGPKGRVSSGTDIAALGSDPESALGDNSIRLKGNNSATTNADLAAFTEGLEAAKQQVVIGQHDVAIEKLNIVLATPGLTTTQSASAIAALADIMLHRSEHQKAEALALLAAMFDPEEAASLNTLARAMIATGSGDAIGAASQAVKLEETNALHHHTLGLAHEAAGNKPAALTAMQRAAALDSDYQSEAQRLALAID